MLTLLLALPCYSSFGQFLTVLWESGLITPTNVDRCLQLARGHDLVPEAVRHPAVWQQIYNPRRPFPEGDPYLAVHKSARLCEPCRDSAKSPCGCKKRPEKKDALRSGAVGAMSSGRLR